MNNYNTLMATKFKSSGELKEILCASAKRNSIVAAIGSVLMLGVSICVGYSIYMSIVMVGLFALFIGISRNINVNNFKRLERVMFVLSTFIVIGILFESRVVTTFVVFLPCMAYLFFVESSKKVRWMTVVAILIAMIVSSSWFFPNLTIDKSSFELRYEALFDVLFGAVFTGVFVRFHMEFMRLSVFSAEQQALNHERYKDASRIAYESLAAQKNELDKVYEASHVALLNERLAHAQIAASQDQLEQFAYAASHDLKEPIRTIRSFLQVVRRRLPAELIEEEGLAEHFEFVEQGSEAMHQLLERLLVYSRIEKATLAKTPVGLVSVLQRICSAKEIGLNDIGAEVSLKLPDELSEIEVFVNPEHAVVIFKELIANAILFRNKDEVLKINIEVDIVNEDSILVEFSDNGIGIQDEYHEQVFGLFKRLNAREEYPGSGLGLSLVRAIVEAATGQVSLTSEFGKGTKVHLLLPQKAIEK